VRFTHAVSSFNPLLTDFFSIIVIAKDDIKAVFGDIEVLLGVNMMLVSMLDAKIAQAKRDPNTHMAHLMIGEVFSKIVRTV
jgi:hypothetical protein